MNSTHVITFVRQDRTLTRVVLKLKTDGRTYIVYMDRTLTRVVLKLGFDVL